VDLIDKIKKLDYKRIAYHLLFWVVITLFYDTAVTLINNGQFLKTIAHDLKYYTPTDILGVYFMLYFLIPKFLLKKKYVKFALFSILFFIILMFVIALPLAYFGLLIDYSDYYLLNEQPIPTFVNFISNSLIFGITVKLMIMGVASSIKIAKIWFVSQKKQQNLVKEKLEINLQLKESELKNLKSQLNPHFLFNALNNLYSLTLEKSPKAPEVVLKISALLDYVLYECNVPSIELETEIENIKNYIDLQKMRYGEDTNIEFNINGEFSHIKIAPLLILPLVENAFKHGLDKNVGKGFIKINIQITEEDKINISIKNSLKGENNHEGEGIGLKNLKKRLELQYPNKHKFSIQQSEIDYETYLCIVLF